MVQNVLEDTKMQLLKCSMLKLLTATSFYYGLTTNKNETFSNVLIFLMARSHTPNPLTIFSFLSCCSVASKYHFFANLVIHSSSEEFIILPHSYTFIAQEIVSK